MVSVNLVDVLAGLIFLPMEKLVIQCGDAFTHVGEYLADSILELQRNHYLADLYDQFFHCVSPPLANPTRVLRSIKCLRSSVRIPVTDAQVF